MNPKILIPFNESESAKNTITFVAENLHKDHEVTLFHVVPNTAAACGLDSPSLTPYFEKERNAFCRMEERRQDMMQVTLETAKAELLNAGFAEDKVHVKTQAQKKGIAADVVQEAKDGEYGMVAMGRRSSANIKEFFLGSNVLRVMHALSGIPMVIVD